MAYSRVRPTRVWRTLEYATTKEECTLESKSCLESMAAPTAAYSRALVFNERLLGVLYKNFDAMQLIQLSLLSQFYCKRLVVYEMTSDE